MLKQRKPKKETAGRLFDPERYGLIFCDKCSGSGRRYNGDETVCVCEDCGGFGLIRKPGGVQEISPDFTRREAG